MKKLITALCISLTGCMATMFLVVTLNSIPDNAQEIVSKETTKFSVSKAPKKKKIKPKKQKQLKKVLRKQPPPPSLASSVGSVALTLPEFDFNNKLITDSFDFKSSIMTGDTVDEKPQVIERAMVSYPPRARNKNIEGYVELSVLIDSKGNVKTVKVVDSTGNGIFDSVAKECVEQWVFRPAKYKNENVDVWVTQIIEFRLS